MRYPIVIERAESNFAAYVPDLPGCVATGGSLEEVGQAIREAIEMHLAGLREDEQPNPQPLSVVEYGDTGLIASVRLDSNRAPDALHCAGYRRLRP